MPVVAGRATAVVVLAVLLGHSHGLSFDLPSSKVKCFSEEISGNTLVVGHYESEVDGTDKRMPVEIQVTDPLEKVLHAKEDISKGSFAFTTTIAGDYIVCFHNKGLSSLADSRRVKLDLKHGVDAKDYTQVMNSDHLTPLETSLRKVRDQIGSIYDEMIDSKHREAQLRDLAEVMCSRVAWFSVFTIIVLVGTGMVQAYYMKDYFHRKKII